jgi:uncharacterized protein (DUF952 family)/N-acetylglutamate synthase-like GNAT family acetyltransferase
MTRMIYHVVPEDQWQAVIDRYAPPDLEREGFVHCSFRHQTHDVIQRYFDSPEGLVVLEIDPFLTGAVVKVEGGVNPATGLSIEGSELFPHLYGAIPRIAVVRDCTPEEFRPYERRHGDYRITDDAGCFDLDTATDYLANHSYWAKGRSREVVERSVERSWTLTVCAADGTMAGMARVVTDWATAYYICDLFILPEHRGRGLGKALAAAIVEHPVLEPLNGLLLTADAHGLYRQFGFGPDEEDPPRFMRRKRR